MTEIMLLVFFPIKIRDDSLHGISTLYKPFDGLICIVCKPLNECCTITRLAVVCNEGRRNIYTDLAGQEFEGEDGPVEALNWDRHNCRLQL